MARTFPTVGVSPCDFYNVDDRSTAYFEHVVTAPNTTEFRNVYAVSTVTLISGANYIGIDSRVTTAGTAAAWVSALYCKVTQGSTKNVNGYLCAAEFELANSAANESANFVMVLNFSNTGVNPSSNKAYIGIRDYGTATLANALLWLGPEIETAVGTKSATRLFSTNVATVATHHLRIVVNSTPYYIMLTNTAAT